MSAPDNPPAFPSAWPRDSAVAGMTMRQFYKGCALAGMLGRLIPNDLGNRHVNQASTQLMYPSDAAQAAARFADALLAEGAEHARK